MATQSLGLGSGQGGTKVVDATIAGVATRYRQGEPTDQDWGREPPPIGTSVLDLEDGILWMRFGRDDWRIMSIAAE